MKLTRKQETFTQEWFITGNKSKAYLTAYNCDNMKQKTVNEKACLLSNQDKIKARYGELMKQSQERNNCTIDSANTMLKDAYDLAKDNASAAGMVSATMGLIKLHGLSAEVQAKLKPDPEKDMSSEEMLRRMADMLPD